MSAVILKFELMYASISETGSNLQNSLSACSAAVHEFRIPPKALLGLHSYCPVHFDAFHAVLVEASVHISLHKDGSYICTTMLSSDSITTEVADAESVNKFSQAQGQEDFWRLDEEFLAHLAQLKHEGFHGPSGHGKHQNPTGFGKKKGHYPTGFDWKNSTASTYNLKLRKYWSFHTKHKVFMMTLNCDGGFVRICERTRHFGYEVAVTIDAVDWIIETVKEVEQKEERRRVSFKRSFRNSSSCYLVEYFSNTKGSSLKISVLKNNMMKTVIIPEEEKANGWSEFLRCLNSTMKREQAIVNENRVQQTAEANNGRLLNQRSWANVVKEPRKQMTNQNIQVENVAAKKLVTAKKFGRRKESLVLEHDGGKVELKLFKLNDLSYRFHGYFGAVVVEKAGDGRDEDETVRMAVSVENHDGVELARLDLWVRKGKDKRAICVKKNPEQIIKDFFEGRLKSITPKSRVHFRAAIISFWADFEAEKKTVRSSILKKTAEEEQEEEKGFQQFGKVYIRKRKSMGHNRSELGASIVEEFYFEGEEVDIDSIEDEMLGLSSDSECSEGEGADPETENSEEQEDIIGDIKELWKQNEHEMQSVMESHEEGQNTRQNYHEDHSWSNIRGWPTRCVHSGRARRRRRAQVDVL
ncbi:hypothetical protein G4B88_021006 [Cannabis sativa]|uniref:Uncharacterized protein n=1 Tax=Cannabis sativa TaxID=3483 RepID=A0A7J6GA88_CANSA|nr:hypothetical protein G4B88_021006 [Cannabis sativa]